MLADPDVFEIVRFQGEVGRVTEEEIALLREVLQDGGETYDPTIRDRIRVGTPVVIAGGALAGTKGRVMEQTGKHNFAVELRTLGVELVISVDAKYLSVAQLDQVDQLRGR